MKFEWNEGKRLANIEKHALDFIDADILFGELHLIVSTRTLNDEMRWLANGLIDDVYVTAIFTYRERIIYQEPVIRLISMRRARDGERRNYQAFLGG